MERLGIECISVFDLPPVAFVHLAADLGCRHISTGLGQAGYNPHQYPAFSLKHDAALRRDMIAAMRARDISISLGEGLLVRPDVEVRDFQADLAIMAELGVACVNTLSLDPDLGRGFDGFALLAEMAADFGMRSSVEFVPGLPVGDLSMALAAIAHVGRAD